MRVCVLIKGTVRWAGLGGGYAARKQVAAAPRNVYRHTNTPPLPPHPLTLRVKTIKGTKTFGLYVARDETLHHDTLTISDATFLHVTAFTDIILIPISPSIAGSPGTDNPTSGGNPPSLRNLCLLTLASVQTVYLRRGSEECVR